VKGIFTYRISEEEQEEERCNLSQSQGKAKLLDNLLLNFKCSLIIKILLNNNNSSNIHKIIIILITNFSRGTNISKTRTPSNNNNNFKDILLSSKDSILNKVDFPIKAISSRVTMVNNNFL